MEIAPENWIGAGGRLGRALAGIAERIPLVCHGLLLNLGGPDPLDVAYLRRLGAFLRRIGARCYGDHLTFCAASGQLYELLPMPFTSEAVSHVAARIRQAQDILEQRLVVENASYYCAPLAELSELEFINGVLTEADCDLLLDVNNVYVNGVNHDYDPVAFIRQLPGERIAYAHVAGHLCTGSGLIVDTHGEAVIDPVWRLLSDAYAEHGVFPTLLERDENIPALAEVLPEVERIASLQAAHGAREAPRRVTG